MLPHTQALLHRVDQQNFTEVNEEQRHQKKIHSERSFIGQSNCKCRLFHVIRFKKQCITSTNSRNGLYGCFVDTTVIMLSHQGRKSADSGAEEAEPEPEPNQ